MQSFWSIYSFNPDRSKNVEEMKNSSLAQQCFLAPSKIFRPMALLSIEKRHTLHVPPPRDIEWPPNHPPTGTATIDFSTNLILDHGSHTCSIDGERRD
jgi:hypothetical protein